MVAPAVADPQFVTLERADREARLGLQASVQFYDDFEDAIGLRTELYGQFAGSLRGGGTLGVYGHMPISHVFAEDADDDTGIGNLELGGYYITRMSRRTDLVFHLGISLPTASDEDIGAIATNIVTGLERNYDMIDTLPDTTALNVGVSLRTPLGAGAFLQGDLALDLPTDKPGDNSLALHANLGVGAFVGSSIALMGELATTFADDDDYPYGFLGSLALGIRFRGAAHPHIAYIYAFTDDDSGDFDLSAHIISFGFYAAF